MNASLIAMIVVLLGASVFVGFLLADYWSREAVSKRARRKRHKEIRKIKREVMQARMAADQEAASEPHTPNP